MLRHQQGNEALRQLGHRICFVSQLEHTEVAAHIGQTFKVFTLPFAGLIHRLVHLVVLHQACNRRITPLGLLLSRVGNYCGHTFGGLHGLDIQRGMVLVHDIANHGGHDPGKVNRRKTHQRQDQRRLGPRQQQLQHHGRALLQQEQEKAQQQI